jgi:putative heme-binding domain-containing protein
MMMKVTLAAAAKGLAMVLMAAGLAVAQDRAARSPRDGDQASRTGQALFRERCAECHGADAKGVIGHDLTRLWTSGATDERVFQTIRSGVPNTLMPSSSAPDDELSAFVSYLRSLNGVGSTDAASGNADHGERIFWATCGSCHAVGVRGGHLGPDLSRIGQSQSRDALMQAIRDPSAAVAAAYQPVTLVTRDGQRIRGARKSEDAFSIQIMDTHEQLQGYLKASLREVIHETSSLMPAFGSDRLNDPDLDDLLLFLNTLRAAGGAPATGRGRGAR